MKKDDLLQLCKLRDELRTLSISVDKHDEAVLGNEEDKKRFMQTVMMSSTDASCRVVESQVQSRSGDTQEEFEAKLLLAKEKAKLANVQAKYDALEPIIEAWIKNLYDWRIREILMKRYIDGKTIRQIADEMRYEYQTIRNMESKFWRRLKYHKSEYNRVQN